MNSFIAIPSSYVRFSISFLTAIFCLPEINAQCIIQNQPVSPSPICIGSMTSDINLTTSGCLLNRSIQWQYSSDGPTWSNTINGTPAAAVYSNSNSTLGFHVSGISASGLYYYRCLLSEDTGFNNWTLQNSAADESWQSVAYGNGLFVAVGRKTQQLMTSPDGIQWTVRNHNCGRVDWNDITYANGLFVAVAANAGGNNVMTSPDGINWTLRTGATANSFQSVTYGNGKFVAVASGGSSAHRVMSSSDGILWTSRLSPGGGAYSWRGVTFGNGLFVAVASSGGGNRIMTSADGIQWTTNPCPANNSWYSVAYGNGLFVAVAISGNGNRVMTSPDGINWTIRNSAANLDWYDVAYGNGRFVAVASSGQGIRVMSSVNGIDWTSENSAADNNWKGLCFANGRFVAVSTSGTGNRVMTSSLLISSVVSVRVLPAAIVSSASSSPVVCLNAALNPVFHISSGATGIGLPTGLPAGISVYWAADSIVITGTPLVSGQFNYLIPLSGGCGNASATGVLEVKASPAPLALNALFACSDSSGILYADSSQSAVLYQLYNAFNTAVAASISGNGSSISWMHIPQGNGYYVIGSDSMGCFSQSNSVNVLLSSVSLSVGSKTDSLCYFDHSGFIAVSVSGGVVPFLCQWADLPAQNNIFNRNNLDTGSYMLVVSDSLGCKDSIEVSIPSYGNCYEWISTTSTDWHTAGNWLQAVVPPDGSRIGISLQASRDLQLDHSHTIQYLYFNHSGLKVLPGDFDLKINEGWSGTDSLSFVSTRGMGRLCFVVAKDSAVKFPVGRSSYNPVQLTNHTSTDDVFCMAVLDEMYSEGAGGYVLEMYPRLRRTWMINKGSGESNSGNGVDFTFYWNVNEDTLNPYPYILSRYNGSMWTELPGTSQVIERSLSYHGYMGEFSMFGINGDFPLPVNWLYLNARCEKDSATLEWETATEINNCCFVAEGSEDGENWRELGKTLAAGVLSSVHKYSMGLSEFHPYVRLKQQDLDGNFTYSSTVSVSCKRQNSGWNIYPNPSTGVFKLMGNSSLQEYTLLNSLGQLLFRSSAEGINELSLDLTPLERGIYTLRLKTDSEEFSKRLILH